VKVCTTVGFEDLGADWDVILPGKRLFESKQRLSREIEGTGPPLARAMMEDTLTALRDSGRVRQLIVVTSDPVLDALARKYGAEVTRDPDTTLNHALTTGLFRTRREASRIAYFVADLPCLTGDAVRTLLAQASSSAHTVVPDRWMRGTTVLATTPRAGIQPQFGDRSFELHVAAGAVPVGLDIARARHDVDWWADLETARDLGLGPHTSSVVASGRGASAR
jgi:2-phospho-L-lactate guanylyltransferase